MPGRRYKILHSPSLNDLESCSLVVIRRFQFGIGGRRRATADHITDFELMFGLSCFADADQKLILIVANVPLKAKNIAQVGVGALVKGAR